MKRLRLVHPLASRASLIHRTGRGAEISLPPVLPHPPLPLLPPPPLDVLAETSSVVVWSIPAPPTAAMPVARVYNSATTTLNAEVHLVVVTDRGDLLTRIVYMAHNIVERVHMIGSF